MALEHTVVVGRDGECTYNERRERVRICGQARCRKAARGTRIAETGRTPAGARAQPSHSPRPEVA